ncbi:MAG TPA: GAF and ANTAR domain-containing protein [Nocardioides sp.]|nr:GAF and ANTAR domain-containing protein [Nocardioides sp.]
MISTQRLSRVFVEVADTLVADFDLIEFLHNLADHTAAVSDAASVGLMLADEHGKLHYMAASTEGAKHLELFQLQHAEGPCLDCYRTGQPVTISDLTAEEARWPAFTSRAREAGVRSVHAFPMRLRDRVLGALNVFDEDPVSFRPEDVKVVQALADIATIAIIQERAISRAETLTEQLQGALNSRIVIEQAKGMIAQRQGVDVDTAFDRLREHARRGQVRLAELARAVVDGTADVPASEG